MTSRWTPAAILVAVLIALVGCGGGGSLVGSEDVPAVIAFDASVAMDAPKPFDIPGDIVSDFASDVGDTGVPTSRCVDPDHDGFGFGLDCLGPCGETINQYGGLGGPSIGVLYSDGLHPDLTGNALDFQIGPAGKGGAGGDPTLPGASGDDGIWGETVGFPP